MRRILTLLPLMACGPDVVAPLMQSPASSEKLGRPTSVILGSPSDVFGSVGVAGDFDGDGYGDVAIGSSDAPCGAVLKCGKLWVHSGSSTGLETVATQTFSGVVDLDRYATAVVSGDFNGDGFDDLVVRNALADHVQTLSGSAGGLVPGADLTTLDATATFGWTMSTGDANGDGFDDLLVGDPNAITFRGHANLFLGSPTGLSPVPATVLEGAADYDKLGYTLAFIGDTDGDGFDEAAILVLDADDGGHDNGKVQIHHGTLAGLETTPATEWISNDYAEAYREPKAAGDINGDGYDDMLVARPYIGPGYYGARVDFFLGGPAGIATTPSVSVSDADVGGYGVFRGHALGDLDLDGHDDIAISFDTPTGHSALAYFYGGTGLGIDPNDLHETVIEPVPTSYFGNTVVTIDTDADGRLDTVVMASGDDTAGARAGAAYYYTGDEDLDEDGFGTIDDCDDTDPDINPLALEVCNQTDDDCNGSADEGLPVYPWHLDADEDGYTDPATEIDACGVFDEYGPPSALLDCDDVDSSIHPEAIEIDDDGIDQDCDGLDNAPIDEEPADEEPADEEPEDEEPEDTVDLPEGESTEAETEPDAEEDPKSSSGGCNATGSSDDALLQTLVALEPLFRRR